jgi:hypothetical protein
MQRELELNEDSDLNSAMYGRRLFNVVRYGFECGGEGTQNRVNESSLARTKGIK